MIPGMVRTREKEKIADMVARHGIRPRAPAPTIPTTRHTHNDSSRMPFALTRINLLFSFTSVGVTEVPLTAGPPSFKIRGQMVHNLGSYRPKDALPPSFAQVYVLDSTNQDDVRSARASNMAFSNAQKQVIKFIQAFMLRHNHFCKT
ncbi:hypothetical protein DYB36_005448 [Aphanomyces astaci]|uniref:Uncharacterized protein n=1 Tax=Aphanomyces astaci TaxID=112090 RepID=A0A397B5Q5_APHAT|nr:hypothetical protein DYB36_005448 [Aphanomyces astaci]